MDLSEYITGEWSAARVCSYNTRDLLTYAVGIGMIPRYYRVLLQRASCCCHC